MLTKIKNRIESERGSPAIAWRAAARIKDGLWRAANCLPAIYLFSLLGSLRHGADFKSIKTHAFFIGNRRSGHSLLASLLDAHQNVATCHELNTLNLIDHGFGFGQLAWLMLNDQVKFNRQDSRHGGYNYYVAGQWHGKHSRIMVLADKMSDEEGYWLRAGSLAKLLSLKPDLRVKFIHTVRNPFDNISTIAKKDNYPLEAAVRHYFALEESIAYLRDNGSAIIDLRHEDFIKDPAGELLRLCDFLEIDAPSDYLEACSGIVWKEAHRTRQDAPWTPELILEVESRMAKLACFSGYIFKE